MVRLPAIGAALLLHAAGAAAAEAQPAGQAPEAPSWSWEASAYQYFLPRDADFLLGIAKADRGGLHLEARWNYEDLRTGSLWAGWNFETGEALKLLITPMAGVVLGRTNGLAPGLELDLSWRWLEWYAEAEYVIDLENGGASYFYLWSELTTSPAEWLALGLVGQRTRVVQTSVEVQRGLLGRLTFGGLSATVYAFNPATPDWFAVAALAFGM
ncbi:MAG TPA: hypothetical protein VFR85_09545 [Anaeromyxobacteraceae bacterium]|nr:hypothetical protein [Anaeromyxobacteraceae bacterium]